MQPWVQEDEDGIVIVYRTRDELTRRIRQGIVVWESGCHEDSGGDDYVSTAKKTVDKDYLLHFLDRGRT